MLPVHVIGGPGKEVPPERARTNYKKKERSARHRNCMKKTRNPDGNGTHRSTSVGEELTPKSAARSPGEWTAAKACRHRPIESTKARSHEAVVGKGHDEAVRSCFGRRTTIAANGELNAVTEAIPIGSARLQALSIIG